MHSSVYEEQMSRSRENSMRNFVSSRSLQCQNQNQSEDSCLKNISGFSHLNLEASSIAKKVSSSNLNKATKNISGKNLNQKLI